MSQLKHPVSDSWQFKFHNRDLATKKRIREHLTTPDDSITENDIRNTKTDTSLFTPGTEDPIYKPEKIEPQITTTAVG